MPDRDGADRLRIRDYADLLLIGSTHGLSDGFSSLLSPVLVLIATDFALSESQIGLLLSLSTLAVFLFVFPTSLVADHRGRRVEMLVIGVAVASLAYASMLQATTFVGVIILSFVARAGNAVYHPCGTALVAERFPSKRPFAISVHSLMGNLGAAFIPLVQAMIADASGWRFSVAVFALPATALLPLTWIRFRKVTRGRASSKSSLLGSSLATARSVLRDRRVLALGMLYALSGMASKSSIGFIPVLATQRFGMGTATIGLVISVYFAMGIVSKPLMVFMYTKLDPQRALAIPLLTSFVATTSMALVPWPAFLIPIVALAGLANPISPVLLTAAADAIEPKKLASSVGVIYTMHGIGFVGPLIGGIIAAGFGLLWAYIFSAALYLVAVFVAIGVFGRRS